MGQHGSKSSFEARVIFQRAEETCERTDSCSTPAPVVRIQREASTPTACFCSSARVPEKSSPHSSWPHSRRDAGALVYVMDNPTGGVWVKPREKWTRSWHKKVLIWKATTLQEKTNASMSSASGWFLCASRLASAPTSQLVDEKELHASSWMLITSFWCQFVRKVHKNDEYMRTGNPWFLRKRCLALFFCQLRRQMRKMWKK